MEHEVNGENEGDGEDEGEKEKGEEGHWGVVGGGGVDVGWGRGSVDVVGGDEDVGLRFVGGVGGAEGDVFCTLRGGSEVGSHS